MITFEIVPGFRKLIRTWCVCGYAGDPGGIFSSGGDGGGELGGDIGDGDLFNFNISFGPNGVSFGASLDSSIGCLGGYLAKNSCKSR